MGIFGLVLLLTAFIAAETGKITARGYRFNGANAIGSLLLGIYAWNLNSWIFVTLESIWVIAAVFFMIERYTASNKVTKVKKSKKVKRK